MAFGGRRSVTTTFVAGSGPELKTPMVTLKYWPKLTITGELLNDSERSALELWAATRHSLIADRASKAEIAPNEPTTRCPKVFIPRVSNIMLAGPPFQGKMKCRDRRKAGALQVRHSGKYLKL